MHAFDGSTTRIIEVAKGSIPFQGDCRRTGDRGLTGHTTGSRVAGEMLSEDATIIVLFLVLWRIDGETLGSMCHLLVADGLSSNLLQRVNPRITYTIAKLFLLAPSHLLRQEISKGFAYDFLLYRTSWTHFCLRIGAHGDIEKLFV